MAAETNGWRANAYQQNAAFVYSSAFTSPVLRMLEPKDGERIVDLGCGSGELTMEIAKSLQHGTVIGYDSSPDMIKKAISQHEGLQSSPIQVSFEVRDGHSFDHDQGDSTCDAVFSNAALHWMKEDPQKVIHNCYKVLKRNGRFVGEMGGHLNMIGVRSALHAALNARGYDASVTDPWYFPTAETYKKLLESAGFQVNQCELIPRITPLPTGLAGWLETFGFSFLGVLKSSEERQEVIEEVCRKLEVDLRDPITGNWTVMYVRLRFKAVKV